MAITVTTGNPETLLKKIKKSINDESILTWSFDDDGDFTHEPIQWKNKAWLRPKITEDGLVFTIFGTNSKPLSRTLYGIYHGRFIEMLLNHFDDLFSKVSASALPSKGDKVNPK